MLYLQCNYFTNIFNQSVNDYFKPSIVNINCKKTSIARKYEKGQNLFKISYTNCIGLVHLTKQ